MGTGYTRNDTVNNIADGNVINASDLDGEFDAVQAAFNESTGHTHDGTSAEGAPVTTVGPAQDVNVGTGAVTPKTDNTVDLGSNSLEFKDLYIDGTANIDSLVADTADINAGTIDGVTIGGAAPGVGTFTTANATTVDTTNLEVTTLKAKDGSAAGSIANSTGVVTLASSVLTTTDINGGTIDSTAIGGSTAAAGSFTTLGASSTATFAAGAVGTPAITTTGDTNTGIFFPAADTIAFAEGGAEAMRIDSSGNVGIGTATQNEKLVVNGAIRSTNNAAGATATADSGVFYFIPTADAPSDPRTVLQGVGTASVGASVVFYTGTSASNSERMRIDSSGNVGIGATSPGNYRLKTVGAGFAFFGDNYFNVGIHDGSASQKGVAFGYNSTSQTGIIAAETSSAASNLAFFTFGGVSWAEGMRIDSSGNVGIGTSSPAQKLDVSGQLKVINGGDGFFINPNASDTRLVTSGTLPLTFRPNDTERMRIDSSGNLLVGTTSALSQTGRATFVGAGNGLVTQVGNSSTAYQSTNTSGTSAYYAAIFSNNGNTFSTCGTIQVSGSTTSYNTSSDYRLKENVAPMTGALAKVLELNPVTYTWKVDGSAGQGFIAHELQEVAPYAVSGEKDGEEMQGVDYGKITPLLTAALQEAIAEIQSLKARVAELEAK
jgi:hypothetical protein